MEHQAVYGADGCKQGWVVAEMRKDGSAGARIVDSADTLISLVPSGGVLLADVPIGLPESGSREADQAARRYLGYPRSCSVFPAPIRSVLEAEDWNEATAIRRHVEGKGMSRQAWGITGKVREMDSAIRKLDPGQQRVREGHPEVSFAAWSGKPMITSKKRSSGRKERAALINTHFGAGTVECLWADLRSPSVAQDDLLDALAMLWSAQRAAKDVAMVLPDDGARDAYGLRMEIVA